MTIKVNQITNAAGTGPVNFSHGITLPNLDSYVRVRGASGQTGSSNVNVRHLHESNYESAGTDITYASNSTSGASFTINTTGLYYISYQDNRQTGAATFSIGINSTASAASIAQADMFEGRHAVATDEKANLGGLRFLTAGDIIYPLTNQTSGFSGADFEVGFLITRIY